MVYVVVVYVVTMRVRIMPFRSPAFGLFATELGSCFALIVPISFDAIQPKHKNEHVLGHVLSKRVLGNSSKFQ